MLRGVLRYPSESGGWQLGNIDLSEHLDKYRDQEVMVIIGSLGKTEAERVICGICGLALDEVGECPRCKLIAQKGARELKGQKLREALFREVEEFQEQGGD